MLSNLRRRTYQRLDGQIKDFGQYRKDLFLSQVLYVYFPHPSFCISSLGTKSKKGITSPFLVMLSTYSLDTNPFSSNLLNICSRSLFPIIERLIVIFSSLLPMKPIKFSFRYLCSLSLNISSSSFLSFSSLQSNISSKCFWVLYFKLV